MIDTMTREAHQLVAAVRAAASVHQSSWEALIPNRFEVNLEAEDAEEEAYSEMALKKAELRQHICATYGISIRELSSLATP